MLFHRCIVARIHHTAYTRRSASVAAMAAAATVGLFGTTTTALTQCDNPNANTTENDRHHDSPTTPLLQKRMTLQQATQQQQQHPYQRRSTTLERIRANQDDVLKRWERDEEEHWRDLPARAWPAVQPDPEESEGIQRLYEAAECCEDNTTNGQQQCREWAFQMATTLVFYSIDAEQGLQRFRALAKLGHVDSMVACGIILVEGLGVTPNEREGMRFLEQALERGSSQAAYELATIYYTGLDGVVEEDEPRAFRLFENAAAHKHTAAMYMMADCLLHGEGTERDVHRAIPIFYKAAEQGHRYARQRIREFLAAKAHK